MNLILLLFVAFVLVPMFLGPFMVKFTHWVAARANITLISPEMLDPDVRTFIDNAKVEFEALGFQFAGYMTLTDYMPQMTGYFGLFTQQIQKISGMAAVLRHAAGKTVRYCEFANKYSNGRLIDVNNSPMMGAYINPKKSVYRYPRTNSIKQLYEINNWVTSHDRETTNLEGLVKGRELEMVCDAFNDEIRLQAKYGYFFLDENNSKYRFTWKGAFIMTEKQTFPVKTILEYLDLQSARKAIAGMSSATH
jgi:hypothetical protein